MKWRTPITSLGLVCGSIIAANAQGPSTYDTPTKSMCGLNGEQPCVAHVVDQLVSQIASVSAIRQSEAEDSTSPYMDDSDWEGLQENGPELKPVPDERFREAREVLVQWQAATESRLPPTQPHQLRFAMHYPSLSGHAQALALELQGPINADELMSRYNWRVTRHSDPIQLTAVPKEELERLICPEFQVELDSQENEISVTFTESAAELGTTIQQVAWNTESTWSEDSKRKEQIHTAAYFAPAPQNEEPARLVRTAEMEIIELPTRADNSTTDTLPDVPQDGPVLVEPEMERRLPTAPVGEIQ